MTCPKHINNLTYVDSFKGKGSGKFDDLEGKGKGKDQVNGNDDKFDDLEGKGKDQGKGKDKGKFDGLKGHGRGTSDESKGKDKRNFPLPPIVTLADWPPSSSSSGWSNLSWELITDKSL